MGQQTLQFVAGRCFLNGHTFRCRLSKFANIGPRNKHSTTAGNDYAFAAIIIDAGLKTIAKPLFYSKANRIGWWTIDGNNADGALFFKLDNVGHFVKIFPFGFCFRLLGIYLGHGVDQS